MSSPRTTGRAALVVAAALALGACGLPDAVVGVHAAPSETTTAASLDLGSAQRITARVLDAAHAAQAETGAAAKTDQEAVLTGAALAVAEAATATHSVISPTPAPLTKQGPPKVLSVSRGKTWPRAILATTLDEDTKRQSLQVLVSTAADAPFKLALTVTMHGGSQIPALGELADGAALVPADDATGMVASAADVLSQYAGALAYPKAAKASAVATKDAFALTLQANARAQTRSLGKLGTLTQQQAVVADDTVAFRLADGGAVVFGLLRRTDQIVLAKTAKELMLPPTYVALSGKKKVLKGIKVLSLEPVVLVVPVTGAATGVGADEQIVSVTGR